MLEFEWDEAKDLSNISKHGLSFVQAKQLFESGADYLEIFDADYSELEDRFIAIGPIHQKELRLLFTPNAKTDRSE